MIRRSLSHGALPLFAAAATLSMVAPATGQAQAPSSARTGAPEDIIGYWVSVVTEDWRWRMVTPAKGDYASVPLNPAGRKIADGWNPDKDIAEGNQCKAYGAPAIMRVP